MIRIWADFTYQPKLLPLIFKGSVSDIRDQNVNLYEGLHIIVYDDSYEAEAVVEKIKGEWWARIIEGTGHSTLAD